MNINMMGRRKSLLLGEAGHSNQESRTIDIQRFPKSQCQKTMLTSTTAQQQGSPRKATTEVKNDPRIPKLKNLRSIGCQSVKCPFHPISTNSQWSCFSLPQTSSKHPHLHEPCPSKKSQPPKFTQSVLSLQIKMPNQKSLANLPVVDPKTYQPCYLASPQFPLTDTCAS